MRVALIGPMHSGKTTAAKMLQNLFYDEYGEIVDRVSFAYELKERSMKFAMEQLGVTDSVDDFKASKEGRQFLQICGRVGRKYDEDFWVKLAQPYIDAAPNAVIDDCRFKNESLALRKNNFLIVRMWRPLSERKASVISEIMRKDYVDRRTAEDMFYAMADDDSEKEQEGIMTDTMIAAGTVNGRYVTLESAVEEFYNNYYRGGKNV